MLILIKEKRWMSQRRWEIIGQQSLGILRILCINKKFEFYNKPYSAIVIQSTDFNKN